MVSLTQFARALGCSGGTHLASRREKADLYITYRTRSFRKPDALLHQQVRTVGENTMQATMDSIAAIYEACLPHERLVTPPEDLKS